MVIGKLKAKKTSTAILKRIIEMRKVGHTYNEIGLEFGLSRERIRQLYKNGNTIQAKTPAPRPWLKTGEVAHLVNVHVGTVRRWANQGILKSYRVGPRGDRRFIREDVDLLFKEKA